MDEFDQLSFVTSVHSWSDVYVISACFWGHGLFRLDFDGSFRPLSEPEKLVRNLSETDI